MAPPLPVAVIVNPAAHKGGAAKRWSAIEAELSARLGPFKPRVTQAPGHATELARGALAEGARRIVAVGGDGTVNEALNGLLDSSGRLTVADAVLCPVPAGTANELCRALGYLADPRRAYDAAASDTTRAIDLLHVRCAGLDGRPVERFGYLIVSRYVDAWHVMNVAVDPAWRGRGVARALLDKLFELTGDDVERGYTLEVRVSNHIAIHLYESLGFVATGVRRGYYTDNREDALIMWRDPE